MSEIIVEVERKEGKEQQPNAWHCTGSQEMICLLITALPSSLTSPKPRLTPKRDDSESQARGIQYPWLSHPPCGTGGSSTPTTTVKYHDTTCPSSASVGLGATRQRQAMMGREWGRDGTRPGPGQGPGPAPAPPSSSTRGPSLHRTCGVSRNRREINSHARGRRLAFPLGSKPHWAVSLELPCGFLELPGTSWCTASPAVGFLLALATS